MSSWFTFKQEASKTLLTSVVRASIVPGLIIARRSVTMFYRLCWVMAVAAGWQWMVMIIGHWQRGQGMCHWCCAHYLPGGLSVLRCNSVSAVQRRQKELGAIVVKESSNVNLDGDLPDHLVKMLKQWLYYWCKMMLWPFPLLDLLFSTGKYVSFSPWKQIKDTAKT